MMWTRPILSLLWAATEIFLALADVEPYYASEDYEQGSFGEWPQQSYKSSSVIGPVLNYHRSEKCNGDGKYIMITPRGNSVPTWGPMILDGHGNLVWTKRYGPTFGLNVQKYRGENYLTFWVGDDQAGHGSGNYYMLDSAYQEAYKISAGNGRAADLHDFIITSEGTAVLTLYDVLPNIDLSSVGGPERGYLLDCGFQEIDIETGQVIFEWWASTYFSYDEAYRGVEGQGQEEKTAWDFFHINSVDKDSVGNYLISSRYMHCLAYINGKSGDIIWKLGGKHNMFLDMVGGATNISWQHDAHFHNNGKSITLFDNASRGIDGFSPAPDDPPSRGLYLDLETENLTAKVRHTYWNPRGITSISQGSLQILDGDDRVIVGYGITPAWTEYTIDGEVLCDVHFGTELGVPTRNAISYRTSKYAWVGRPETTPDMAIDGNQVYVSWNGATEVATWIIEGTRSTSENCRGVCRENYHILSSRPKTGFETVIEIPDHSSYRFLRARGLDRTGYLLGFTETIELGNTTESRQIASYLRNPTDWLLFSIAPAIVSITLLAVTATFIIRKKTSQNGRPWENEEIEIIGLLKAERSLE
ncbi:ASST-domain-containing protein [Talaromyces proteolyticus]|uniref:ASST-domain-containing protein n=1 Tax=Talaromyces proteolyticus TaxID=1131652 RepID=A0AAD4L0Y8_9EURO|nr:ASST-domain-containing protein [Talaromyces proteolyticus]KAH8700889.1 ASST-domain-containing protein [Talaromyces proteolyticus]